MLNIEYEIKLNERGRPCIDLPPDYAHNPEDKFFALEIARYYLQSVYNRMGDRYDQHTKETMDISIRLMGQIGDEMAELIYNDMKTMGDVAVTLGGSYHVNVLTIEERDAIPEIGFLYNGKIFNRQEGLKVLVLDENGNEFSPYALIYVLKNGVTNDNWVKIG
jgi:hypothetical protein